MASSRGDLLRSLPAVDVVLHQTAIQPLIEAHGHSLVVQVLRRLLADWRQRVLQDSWQPKQLQLAIASLPQQLRQAVEAAVQPSLCPVINATGVIIHTNLGRSLLADSAREQIVSVASSFSTLEVDVATGERGSRYSHVVDLLRELTGAEDALVVNNNAGAVLLMLAALAGGREVVVSRGQLVEIGGSFRIPEVMEQGGCRLVEVGTTNKTHPADFLRAIRPETAALMKVHTSNYRVLGFTSEVSSEELVQLAHQRGLLAVEDLGSGVLIDLQELGLPHEPTVQAAVQAGMDVVTFSGDKLLGGPQAGIIVGKTDCINLLRKHPLTRALRIDKLTLAGLEATLRLYRDPEQAIRQIPTLRMLALTSADLRPRAEAIRATAAERLRQQAEFQVVESAAQVGGGSLPGHEIPSLALAIRPRCLSLDQLEANLRQGQPALFSRIQKDQLLLDLRTVQPEEDDLLLVALAAALGGE